MSLPFPLQSTFAGMVQDRPRDGLPPGSLWNIVDFIPEYLGAPLRKRGGWSYASLSISGTYIDAVAYAPFSAGAKNFAISQDGNAYTFTAGATTSLGAAFAVAQNPVYHRKGTAGLLVIPAGDGTTAPKSWDGTTYGALSATAPAAKYADVWKDRTILANGTSAGTLYPNRVWFSPIGDPTSVWDLTYGWEDASFPVIGTAVLNNTILMFHQRTTERLRGSIPPSVSTVGDFVQDSIFSVGCIDARSIVKYNETVIWADARGVYQSDGAALKDLTKDGGILNYWRTTLASYAAGYTVAAGIYNDTYIVSVMNGTTFVDCLAYDLGRGFWIRFANFPARAFSRQGSTSEETYMALGNAGRIASLSSIVSPSAAVKNDANGTAVTPYFETGLYRGFMHLHRRWIPSFGLQDWKDLYFNYDLRDAAADTPTISVSYATDPGATSYTTLSRTLAATTQYTRARRLLGFNANGLMLKVAQTGPSSDTRMSAFESDYSAREVGRLKQ